MNRLDQALNAPLLLTVHGWNSPGRYMHGYDEFAARRGFVIFNFEYGWILFATARNRGIVHRILDFVLWYHDLTGQRTVMIGHSHGCKLAWEIARKTELVIGLALNNAALDEDVAFPPHVRFVHNWYTPGDLAVRIGGLIPGHSWGRLGARPYAGPSPQVRDFNKGADFPDHVSRGHSDTYSDHRLRRFYLPRQIEEIEGALDAER